MSLFLHEHHLTSTKNCVEHWEKGWYNKEKVLFRRKEENEFILLLIDDSKYQKELLAVVVSHGGTVSVFITVAHFTYTNICHICNCYGNCGIRPCKAKDDAYS